MSGNRLGDASSSYLRTAAHQPTHWFPWSAEAFEEARKQDKPILLDIGAVWCHWCHVMDRESYESDTVASVINEKFIAIKVDRDERPDVDTRYQKAIQAMIGQGGWPLTVFLLPDGRPFYGGTYFPPVDAHGRPSFLRVLNSVSEAYSGRKEEALESATRLMDHLAKPRARSTEKGAFSAERIEEAVVNMESHFDVEWGGFGRAPKFPHPAAQDLLIAQARRGQAIARDMVVTTLEQMRAGGIYDQLAGGFHRYSVDREWLVPHFEKMLYDNAGLLRNYSRAGQAFGHEGFQATAREIMNWMEVTLGQPEGGYGGSQDADVGMDDDGDFFTWTLDEIRTAVGNDDAARLVQLHFGLSEEGHMHHNPAKSVLRVVADTESIAAGLKREVGEVQEKLAAALDALCVARAARPAPFVDPLRYSNWNGMAIQAVLEAAGHLGDEHGDTVALRALDAFLSDAYEPGRGFARSIGSDVFGMLDDNAQMLDALLEAHLATGESRYLETAREVGDLLLSAFPHPEGGFADRAETLAPDAEAPTLRSLDRPTQDAPTASPNGVALRALLRLADATGEERYRKLAVDALTVLADDAVRGSIFSGAILLAVDAALTPPVRVEVQGDASGFRETLRRYGPPGAVLVSTASGLPADGALVCLGDRCLAPAHDAKTFLERLQVAR